MPLTTLPELRLTDRLITTVGRKKNRCVFVRIFQKRMRTEEEDKERQEDARKIIRD